MLARLFQKLSETGWLERSLVVVFSDHGEQFLEHGKLLHTRNHHRELLHVPLLLHGPSLPSGVRVAEPVSLVDIAPTVLSLLGIESTADLDGIDLQPFFREPAATGDRRPIFAEAGASIGTDTLRSVQDGRHKLIQDMSTGRQSLYDLLEDPGETRDVVGEQRDVATALADRLERFADSRLVGGVAPEMPEEMREQLRALGYEE